MNTGLQAELARLEDAHQVLMAKWEQVRELWQDRVAESVEEQYLIPLAAIVHNAQPAIGQIGDELNRAIRVCSEPRDAF